MQKQTKPKPLGLSMAKLVLVVAVIVSLGAVLGILGYTLTKPKPAFTPIPKTISAIEISEDGKSILNAETKTVIFTIADTQKYLKDSGYAYNPDTFQDANAKHAGDCFTAAAISNNKDRIVFSSGCLAGDLPQAWVGVYNINWGSDPNTNCVNTNCLGIPKFKFLIGGNGKNFIWSSYDKTITYEADLELSGMTETRTIDARTGEILDTKKEIENPETSCRNLCGDGICQEIVCMAIGCPCAETPQSCPQDCQKNETGTENWKTYRNEEYGFEIKYPKEDWEAKEYNDGTPRILISSKEWRSDMPEGGGSVVVDLKNISLNDFISEYRVENKEFCEDPVFDRKKITLNGLEAEKMTGCTAIGLDVNMIFTIGNNRSYIINYQDHDPIHRQIISTFKFIEK